MSLSYTFLGFSVRTVLYFHYNSSQILFTYLDVLTGNPTWYDFWDLEKIVLRKIHTALMLDSVSTMSTKYYLLTNT